MTLMLITGGTGYIGSHAAAELMEAGHDVFLIDNSSNSKRTVLDRIERIVRLRPGFARIDVRDRPALRQLPADRRLDAAIHCPGLKAMGESVAKALKHLDNDVLGSVALFECMRRPT